MNALTGRKRGPDKGGDQNEDAGSAGDYVKGGGV